MAHAQAYAATLPAAAVETLLMHMLAAIEALVHVRQRPAAASRQGGAQMTDSLLAAAVHACLQCLCTAAQLPLAEAQSTELDSDSSPSAVASPFALARPLSEAAAALLSGLQQRAADVVSEPLYAAIASGLSTDGPCARAAALTALLVSLESRHKPRLPARAVPDTLALLVHVLADSPLPHAGHQVIRQAKNELVDEVLDAFSEAALCLRCAESIATQAAVFRKLGPAGPALFTSATRVAAAASALVRCAAPVASVLEVRLNAAMAAVVGVCGLASSVLRNREGLVKLTWPGVAPCCTSALLAIVSCRQACAEELPPRCGSATAVASRT